MNALEASPEVLATMDTRERVAGKVEVCCPTCRQWRPGFCVVSLSSEEAAANGGIEWACDGDVTRWRREA